ncbi:hypothetical protein H1R20_g10209, partial [Candolleomyces eurysporus]
MEPEARNAPPERWLPSLCSQLSGAQSVREVQAILDGLGASSLSNSQVENVLRQLLNATEHKQLLELVLAYIDDVDEADAEGIVVGKKQKQFQQMKAHETKSLSQQDLSRLNVTEPWTKEEASCNAEVLLDMLKGTLSQYLDLLRDPSVCLSIQNLFVVLTHPNTGNHKQTGPQRANDPPVEEAPVDPAPVAYPSVQPMKAALYFESAPGLGEWRILISTRADRELRKARRGDTKFFKSVIKKIVHLSKGRFHKDNQRRLNHLDVQVPVYEAKLPDDHRRLVYQIDCIPEYDKDLERQVVKIFGIYTRAQIEKDKRFWDSIGYQLSQRGEEYRHRCTFREEAYQKGDGAIPPAEFHLQDLEQEASGSNTVPVLPEEDLEEIHSLLVLEKFVTLSKELLYSIFADLEVAHVFNVTPQEKEIIEHPNSCYVLGRSGTGKTTTMLFKMLGIERAYTQHSAALSVAKPRQIFVTQSRVLATRVEEYFLKLLESLAAGKKSNEDLKEMAEQKKVQPEGEEALYDVDDDVMWKAGLPKKFSLLQDEHFPLFLTFERLCQLLEGDIENAVGITSNSKRQLITYDAFLDQYWPHFPQGLTKNLDPALVFNEFLGVIKGSEQSLDHATGYLDLTGYRNLSHRTQHLFANQRDRIYSLFQAYMKQKKQRSEIDSADRTHRILKAFDATGIPGRKIDYLCVDEAQDNLLIDAMVLRSLCRNPNGLFWAGDTAQTIAIGSSFRFNDLKAFLYRFEQRREQGERGITQSELRTFQLAVNYRSHAGIVRCATAIVELITHFWPYAIDSLAPERGIVDGAKPVFYSGWDTNTVEYKQFLSGKPGEQIEFGARQCILVRDDAAKAELRKQVGDIGLILTLYESKGLEFDDVVLYKFFEDSTVDLVQWRVVLNLVKVPRGQSIYAPRFDEERHAGVCSELKFLYVAITRSRKNLWIIDCSDKAEPMKMLWESKGYIHSYVPGGDVPRLAQKSDPEEWATAGRTLFTNRRYLQAMHAFERAGRAREAKISYTYSLRDTARSIRVISKENITAKRNALCSVAESFLKCAQDSKGKERRVFFHNAAECFEEAGSCGDSMDDYERAARAYKDAKEYNTAVRLYKKTEMFDEAVHIIKNHRQEVNKGLANNVEEVARLFYFKKKDFKKARSLFESDEEQLEYLRDNILLDDCHAAVLAKLGRHKEAAEIHMEEGRTMEAIDTLLDHKENKESKRQANDWIFQGLWENTSFSRKIEDTDAAALEFLRRASKVSKDAKLLSPTRKDELELFQSLRKPDGASTFRRLAYRFLGRGDKHQTVLCFDHYFINFPSTLEITNADMVTILEDFGQYCRSFRDLILCLDVTDEDTQRLFNFRPVPIGNAYRVRTKTWLCEQITDASTKLQVLERDDEFITVSNNELQHFLQAVLWQRLEQRILNENSLCHRIQVFTPCLPFVMNRECHRANCPRHHVNYQELTQDWFNRQIRIHLLQILIYHVYLGIPTPKDRDRTIQDRRREGTVYVVPELYHCLRAADRSFISAGIVFFQHIVDKKINIDINVLCHLAEFLAGSVILARVRFNLHYVVLPRGWILALLRQIVMKEPDTMLLDRLLLSMKSLLEGLVKGGEEAIGYNIRNRNLQDEIFQMLQVLQETGKHHSFRRFATARSWGGMFGAVETSCTMSHLDEMVQLCSIEKPKPQKPPSEGIRRVFFKNLEDVPVVLSTSPLNAQAKPFVPSTLELRVNVERGSNSTVEGQGGDAAEVEQPEADVTDLVDSRNIVDSLASTAAPLSVEHISQEQKGVALCLLKKYRQRARNQKLEKKKTPTQKDCDSYFEACLELALDRKKMQWPHGFYYRKLYLGLVPHLLACIKGVGSYAFSAKAKAKKRYRGDEKQDYDGMHKTTNEIVAILKGCKNLGSRLDPSSEVHKKRDIEGLKQLVREVEELVNRVPLGTSLNIHTHLQLAIKGILREPKPIKAKPKPELNVEDDLV